MGVLDLVNSSLTGHATQMHGMFHVLCTHPPLPLSDSGRFPLLLIVVHQAGLPCDP